MVLRQISSLGVKAQAIIAGASYAFWDILLPTTEEAVALTKKPLENKDYFFRTEYMGRRRTTVSVYEVPSFLRDAFQNSIYPLLRLMHKTKINSRKVRVLVVESDGGFG